MKRPRTNISDGFGRIFHFEDYGDIADIELQKGGCVLGGRPVVEMQMFGPVVCI